jgi:hypothetical protein
MVQQLVLDLREYGDPETSNIFVRNIAALLVEFGHLRGIHFDTTHSPTTLSAIVYANDENGIPATTTIASNDAQYDPALKQLTVSNKPSTYNPSLEAYALPAALRNCLRVLLKSSNLDASHRIDFITRQIPDSESPEVANLLQASVCISMKALEPQLNIVKVATLPCYFHFKLFHLVAHNFSNWNTRIASFTFTCSSRILTMAPTLNQ